tara:strand:+ start:3968 stop:4222 length:255 start_codon:yes stop_codon:yes gene_type:complete
VDVKKLLMPVIIWFTAHCDQSMICELSCMTMSSNGSPFSQRTARDVETLRHSGSSVLMKLHMQPANPLLPKHTAMSRMTVNKSS